MSAERLALMLRFRDLVTEPGGNIAEHRRIMKLRGYVWWGWWARQIERAPRGALADLFREDGRATEVLLFDSGMMRLYRTAATRVVVAPSHLGLNSPDFEATPDYYVRGRYPAWFRFEGDIVPIDGTSALVISRPSVEKAMPQLDHDGSPEEVSLETLSREGPTLWLVAKTLASS